jgi:hypothetical protein
MKIKQKRTKDILELIIDKDVASRLAYLKKNLTVNLNDLDLKLIKSQLCHSFVTGDMRGFLLGKCEMTLNARAYKDYCKSEWKRLKK